MSKHLLDDRPAALSKWATWHGAHASEMQTNVTERLMGGMIANSPRKVYSGLFKRWGEHRSVLGQSQYLSTEPADQDENEAAVIAYVVLNLGTMERDVGTVQNHLQSIGYFRKAKFGATPLREMFRLQNVIKGARREKGPAERKLPVTTEDLNHIYDVIDWPNPDSVTLWCTISIAWFFMLRMSEYLDRGAKTAGDNTRRPLTTDEIEPLRDGRRAVWSAGVNEISIYISGSKTDWLNQGMVRSHNLIPSSEPNSHLCPARCLIRLWELAPAKFRRNTAAVLPSWKSGTPIKPDRVVALLRSAVFKQGFNPTAFSLHSLRAGGATALYRATWNIELVARAGRWGTSSISAYLWESHEVMRGLGKLMAQGGHTHSIGTLGI